MDIFLDILLKPPQPLIGLFLSLHALVSDVNKYASVDNLIPSSFKTDLIAEIYDLIIDDCLLLFIK